MSALFAAPVAPSAPVAPERRVRPTAPVRVSSRTRWGFRSPQRSLPKSAGGLQVALLDAVGADWAFDAARSVAPAAPAPAPVVAIPAPAAPAPVAASPAALEAPVAPAAARIPAGAASVRVCAPEAPFRVVVVDLDDDSLSSVSLLAASPLAARRECSDEFALPVAVFAILPGGGEELVWGEVA